MDNDAIKRKVSRNIKKCISVSGKDLRLIVYELDSSESTLRGYMSGANLPGAAMIIKMCLVLDCTYEDILGKPEDSGLVKT